MVQTTYRFLSLSKFFTMNICSNILGMINAIETVSYFPNLSDLIRHTEEMEDYFIEIDDNQNVVRYSTKAFLDWKGQLLLAHSFLN